MIYQNNTMITYQTINEAFQKGTGDVFFFNANNEYIAVSRHSVDFERMTALGFTHLHHDRVIEIGRAEKPAVKNEPVIVTKHNEQKKQFVHYSDSEVWGFLEDFPEFYNHCGL